MFYSFSMFFNFYFDEIQWFNPKNLIIYDFTMILFQRDNPLSVYIKYNLSGGGFSGGLTGF